MMLPGPEVMYLISVDIDELYYIPYNVHVVLLYFALLRLYRHPLELLLPTWFNLNLTMDK